MFPRLYGEHPLVQRLVDLHPLLSITSVWIFVSLFIGFCFNFVTCIPLPSSILARGVHKERHNVEEIPRRCQTWTAANRLHPIDFLPGGLSLYSAQQRGDRERLILADDAFGCGSWQDLVVVAFLANLMECMNLPRDGISSTTLFFFLIKVLFVPVLPIYCPFKIMFAATMSFPSLILRSGVVSLAYFSFLADPIAASTSNTYLLSSEYSGANFFDGFDFYTVSILWTHI